MRDKKREDHLWELCKNWLRQYASIQRTATENEKAIYRASLSIWGIHEAYRVNTVTYISKKEVESHRVGINNIKISTGAKELEARQAVQDALEYLDLVTFGRVRQPKGECRVF